MAFTVDLPAAARRHLQAADSLDGGHRRDVAGYLYGIAAECAVKSMMEEIAVRVNEIFYAHFPELRTLLRDRLQGRRAGPLATLIQDDGFLNHWNAKMRYSSSREIKEDWVDTWREQARKAVATMGTLG